ncbi:MAG: preprotein translocase subunit YajC [Deltaproteobacteria bacterium]|nr:preprotein translocase subunit YajC [Deltaproteobacteria bacterium]
MLLLFAPMFLVIYFFIIRPQNKKMKEHRAVVEKVKSGDEIVTAAGIFGTVTGVTEKVLTVEIADGVKIKLLKSQVATVNPTK